MPDSLRGRAGKSVVIGGSELTDPPSTKNPVSSTGLPGIGAVVALAYDTEIYLTGSRSDHADRDETLKKGVTLFLCSMSRSGLLDAVS